jgi:hypothetical protein
MLTAAIVDRLCRKGKIGRVEATAVEPVPHCGMELILNPELHALATVAGRTRPALDAGAFASPTC